MWIFKVCVSSHPSDIWMFKGWKKYHLFRYWIRLTLWFQISWYCTSITYWWCDMLNTQLLLLTLSILPGNSRQWCNTDRRLAEAVLLVVLCSNTWNILLGSSLSTSVCCSCNVNNSNLTNQNYLPCHNEILIPFHLHFWLDQKSPDACCQGYNDIIML